jgi:hypothetical protein
MTIPHYIRRKSPKKLPLLQQIFLNFLFDQTKFKTENLMKFSLKTHQHFTFDDYTKDVGLAIINFIDPYVCGEWVFLTHFRSKRA